MSSLVCKRIESICAVLRETVESVKFVAGRDYDEVGLALRRLGPDRELAASILNCASMLDHGTGKSSSSGCDYAQDHDSREVRPLDEIKEVIAIITRNRCERNMAGVLKATRRYSNKSGRKGFVGEGWSDYENKKYPAGVSIPKRLVNSIRYMIRDHGWTVVSRNVGLASTTLEKWLDARETGYKSVALSRMKWLDKHPTKIRLIFDE